MESIRLDRWLCAARIFKSRTLAAEACSAGKVQLNDNVARAAQAVKLGDRVKARAPRGDLVLVVAGLADKRLSPPLARGLYQDETPEAPPREPGVFVRARGAGRPTKAERRRMQRVRGVY
jgi:ribosome-associated heat shock protein Hsp15